MGASTILSALKAQIFNAKKDMPSSVVRHRSGMLQQDYDEANVSVCDDSVNCETLTLKIGEAINPAINLQITNAAKLGANAIGIWSM